MSAPFLIKRRQDTRGKSRLLHEQWRGNLMPLTPGRGRCPKLDIWFPGSCTGSSQPRLVRLELNHLSWSLPSVSGFTWISSLATHLLSRSGSLEDGVFLGDHRTLVSRMPTRSQFTEPSLQEPSTILSLHRICFSAWQVMSEAGGLMMAESFSIFGLRPWWGTVAPLHGRQCPSFTGERCRQTFLVVTVRTERGSGISGMVISALQHMGPPHMKSHLLPEFNSANTC